MGRFFQDLLDRRVPHVVALYLGGSWAVIEFMAFLEDRFFLSPHVTNLVLSLLVLVLPSVILFTYHHGRPGADRWRRVEKVFIPANLLVAAGVLLVTFGGKDLGPVTKVVQIVDEQGNPVERTVPKSEYRKRLALFPLDAPGEEGWLGEAAIQALYTDLYQDVFLDVRVPAHYLEGLKERGYQDALSVPMALKRELASDMNLRHFVAGEVSRRDGGYQVTVELHETDRGAAVDVANFRGPELLPLVDSVSRALRRGLDLPESHLEETQDLPVSEMTTDSPEAFRHYALGGIAWHYSGDHGEAVRQLQRAVEIDPSFADAQFSLYLVALLTGQRDVAAEALDAAMDHLYRLPERYRFQVKAEHYAFRQELGKAHSVAEMWVELYPNDLEAQALAAAYRRLRHDLPGVIEALEAMLTLEPSRTELLEQIGGLYEQLGDLDRAKRYFREYADLLPDRPDPYLALGDLYRAGGSHSEARASYERALVLDPGNVSALVGLAHVARVTGDWAEAEARVEQALGEARSPQARHAAHAERRSYHAYRGDYETAVRVREQMMEALREYVPPVSAAQVEISGIADYARAGRGEEALQRLDELTANLPEPADVLIPPVGRARLLLALELTDSAEAALEQAERAVEATGFQIVAGSIARSRGRLHELRGEWRKARDSYRRQQRLEPSNPEIAADLGRVHRELGELEAAESLLLETLSLQPSHGRANYDLGLVYLDLDRPNDSVRHLERALDTWQIAAPDYEPAARARAALREARLQLRPVRPRG